MKIYDISQEIFSSEVWIGDPAPERRVISSIADGDLCNITAFSMCTHNGTHIDAPCHFINDGESVDMLSLEKLIGPCFVAEHSGFLACNEAFAILDRAGKFGADTSKRILLKGKCTVSNEAAKVFADAGICLLGNESQSVGPEDAPMAVHLTLLGAGVVLLEGVRLADVCEGAYFLCAQPLSLADSDGAPCRAVLIDNE